MKSRILFGAGMVLGLALLASPVLGQSKHLKSATTGNPKVESIQAISFGPQGLLLIGDGQGKQVIVVDTGDTKPMPWSNKKIEDIQGKLAGRLGTTAKGIEIKKIAVNPASQTVYCAVRNLAAKKDIILTINGNGKINEFALDNVKHARVALPAAQKGGLTFLTDITWGGSRILVAAQAAEVFGNKFLTIPVPVKNEGASSVFSAQTYHVAHRRWETKAPIRTMMYLRQGKDEFMVGAFTCTPVVKYPINELQPGTQVKGQSVLEVGSGNQPLNMFLYEKDGKKYVLMNTFRRHHKRKPVGPSPYWTVKINYDLLEEDKDINEKALKRVDKDYEPVTDRAVVVEAYHGVAHLGKLNDQQAITFRVTKSEGMDLEVLALP